MRLHETIVSREGACQSPRPPPSRGARTAEDRGARRPRALLISRVGLDAAEVAGMTKDEAAARMQRYWAGGD
ncbi:hypothetical protein [Saccharopolyspora sp. CA-218241]|uniref:hypothetical protein n=1 Tax=Saccharopolyspora sp. CA-218241 TaxID=3240027 RepID=UPI003D9991F3